MSERRNVMGDVKEPCFQRDELNQEIRAKITVRLKLNFVNGQFLFFQRRSFFSTDDHVVNVSCETDSHWFCLIFARKATTPPSCSRSKQRDSQQRTVDMHSVVQRKLRMPG